MSLGKKTEKHINKSETSIIIGDPNSYARAMISEVLRNLGYQKLYTAASAGEIVDAANVFQPNIIILENLLPDLAGTELVSKIRREPIVPDRGVPCIMLTSDHRLETVTEARLAGIDEFAAKPVSTKVIESRVNEVLLRPRPFIVAKKYVGPCRRRKRLLSYSGPLKRLEDPDEVVHIPEHENIDVNRRMLIDCTNVLEKVSKEINPKSRAEVRQLYNSATEAFEIAKKMKDDALQIATQCVTHYIQGVGASGALSAEVMKTQVGALRLLLDPAMRDRSERIQIAAGLKKIVIQKLKEAA